MTNLENIQKQAKVAGEWLRTNKNVNEQGKQTALALIEAAKLLEQVVVLERGAEPEVGDLVEGVYLRDGVDAEIYYGKVEKGADNKRGLALSGYYLFAYKRIKIITRNNKRVIYKD